MTTTFRITALQGCGGRAPLLLLGGLLLAGCVPAGQYEKLGEDYELQGQQIFELKEENDRLNKSTKSLTKEVEELREKAKQLEELEALKQELETIKKEFLDYKEKYRLGVRKKAVGTDLGQLVTRDGRRYENAIVRGFTETEMLISHRAGLATIDFKNLSGDLQKQYLFSEADLEEAALLTSEPEAGEEEAEKKRESPSVVEARKQLAETQAEYVKKARELKELNIHFEGSSSLTARITAMERQVDATAKQIYAIKQSQGRGIRMSKADLDKKLKPLESRLVSLETTLDAAVKERRRLSTQKDSLERVVRSMERKIRWLKGRIP